MGRVIREPLQIIKESIVKHVTAVLAVGDGLVSQIALHLDDPGDFLVLDLLELRFREFAAIDGFPSLEDDLGTLQRTNVFGAEGRREGPGGGSVSSERESGTYRDIVD
jgi:hypothetical protein